jgi:hypothetical protein
VQERRATHLAAEPFARFLIVIRQLFFCQSTASHWTIPAPTEGVGTNKQAEKNDTK